jgi:Protein of unknown function (DUF1353)
MSDIHPLPELSLEREKIELERYKAQLDFRKFVLGSVFVALAVAAIPPSFQLATAVLEKVKSDAERQAKQQAFRDDYIKQFINNALNQDIELRIRFAQYFARVSTEPYRQDWLTYLNDLKATRTEIRDQINKMEAEWRLKMQVKQRDQLELDRLGRILSWAYKEVGYVERDRSAAVDPRQEVDSPTLPVAPPTLAPSPSITSPAPPPSITPLYLSRFVEPVYFLTKPLSWNPDGQNAGKFEPVQVPAGFVATLDSVPQTFWSVLRPDGAYVIPVIIHDYLYWTQTRPREMADEIFRLAMEDVGVDKKVGATIYQATKVFGKTAWDENTKLKAQGEKRILRDFPRDPRVRWADWKKRPGVFSEEVQ